MKYLELNHSKYSYNVICCYFFHEYNSYLFLSFSDSRFELSHSFEGFVSCLYIMILT